MTGTWEQEVESVVYSPLNKADLRDHVHALLAAAEARGLAEAAAKVGELAARSDGYDHDHGIGDGHERCPACWVDDLRALAAELSAPGGGS